MPREVVIPSNHPRVDAIKYVTDHGKHTLVVQNFLNAAKPGGQDAMQIDLDGMPVDFEMVSDLNLCFSFFWGRGGGLYQQNLNK